MTISHLTRRAHLGWWGIGSWVALILGCFAAPRPAQTANPVPSFESTPCPFTVPAGQTIQCGYLITLEDHAQSSGPTIQIAVAIVKRSNPAPEADPLVFLNGGPGAPTLNTVPNLIKFFSPILGTRDMIFFDQRGVGASQPALSCPEFDTALSQAVGQTFNSETAAVAEAIRQCHARLTAAGIKLETYTSAQSAADLEDLRLTLGIQQWNLYGVSYGTRLGLTMIRDYPDHLRSVILDSVFPPQADLYAESTANADRAFNVLFDGCAHDLICNTVYPNLKTVFYNLANEVETQPVSLAIKKPGATETVQAKFDSYMLADSTFNSLYFAQGFTLIPGLVYDAHDGDYTRITQLLGGSGQASNDMSVGMAISVLCNEEAPFTSKAMIEAARAPYPTLLQNYTNRRLLFSEETVALCKEWTTALPNPVENQPVTGSTPTLLLSGEYDPITPPSWAQATAAHLTHSYYFEIPAVGHGVAQGGNCPVGLMLEFLHDPAQQPDAACISRMDSAPDFVIRAAVTRRPVSFVTLGLGLVLAVLVVQVGLHFWRTPLFPFTLWHSFRQLNLIPLAIGVGLALVLILAKSSSEMASLRPEQITATLLPVIAAIQAAFLFSPEDEPALEAQLATPRPLRWTILERAGALLALYGTTALIVSGVATATGIEPFGVAVARWVPILILLVAIAICLTVITRQAIFSVGLTGLLWFGMVFAGGGMIIGQPWLWPLDIYLQPDHPLFWLNRGFLTMIGLGLLTLAATYLVRDEERVLLGGRTMQKTAKSEPHEQADPGWQPLTIMTSLTVHQLLGMIHYEFLLNWRRRTLLVLFLAAMVVPLVAAFKIRQDMSEIGQVWLASGSVAPEIASDLVTTNMILVTWAPMYLVLVLLLVPAVADTIPRDQAVGVRELLDSLPLSLGTYLTGKMLGTWVSVLAGVVLSLGAIGMVWWFLVGHFNLGDYLQLAVFGAATAVVLNSALGVLLPASQPSRRRAVLIGVTVALFSLYALFIALGSPIGFWYWFNPSRPAIFAYFIWGRVSVNTPGDMQLPVWNDVLATIGLGLGQVAVVGAALYGWLRWQARRA